MPVAIQIRDGETERGGSAGMFAAGAKLTGRAAVSVAGGFGKSTRDLHRVARDFARVVR